MKGVGFGVFAFAAFVGCHNHPDYYIGPSIKGFSYLATASVVGIARDTLSIGVTTYNRSTESTALEFPGCYSLNQISAEVFRPAFLALFFDAIDSRSFAEGYQTEKAS